MALYYMMVCMMIIVIYFIFRFHPFTPGHHLDYRIPKKNPDWYPKYNPYLKEGRLCVCVFFCKYLESV